MEKSKDKEKVRRYNAQYRQQHKVAIAIKSRLYKQLPRVKARDRGKRNKYLKEYYRKNRDKHLKRSREWAERNQDKRRLYNRRYKEKLRQKRKAAEEKTLHTVEKVLKEFFVYVKSRNKESTYRQYNYYLPEFCSYIQGKFKVKLINELSKEMVIAYVRYINSEEHARYKRTLRQTEKESRLYPMKKFLIYLCRKDYVMGDFSKFIVVPRNRKQEKGVKEKGVKSLLLT